MGQEPDKIAGPANAEPSAGKSASAEFAPAGSASGNSLGLGPATRALVTGGGGFLGRALVGRLLDLGVRVRILARGDYPELAELGVDTLRGDIADSDTVRSACTDCDIVFHTAAKAGVWGPYGEYYRTNFTGTVNVVDACSERGVGRLVYTSTPSVVFSGGDIEGADESLPYPASYKAPYAETKAMAERYVLDANSETLATVALRPHLIWGPGDPHLVPRVLDRARRGRLRLVGDGQNKVDTTYIEDAALAHVLVARKLAPGSPTNPSSGPSSGPLVGPPPSGRAYFISQGDPRPIAEIFNLILAAGGLPPVERSVSPRIAYAVGAIMEGCYGFLNIKREPMMTRFVAEELATAHWFDLGAAQRDFNYRPQTSIEEGMERLAAWLKSEGIAE